nr:hypothetical protein [uncultured Flavobacterium sp.]
MTNNNRIKINFWLKLILIFGSSISFAQHTKAYNMEHLKSKNKNELVELALEILKEKQPSITIDPDDFEGTAWGNSKEIIVKFRRCIRFIPLYNDPEKRFSYDITVNLNTNEISPFDDTFKSEFYIETDEDKKAIEFIKKNFGIFSSDFENTIYEGEEDYYIDCKNKYSFGKYVVNKKTGRGKPEIQTSYEPMLKPNVIEDLDVFIEIK